MRLVVRRPTFSWRIDYNASSVAVDLFSGVTIFVALLRAATPGDQVQSLNDESPIGRRLTVEKWPLGVFASIDAGLGVKLEVAHALGVPTIQLHAPAQATRTAAQAEAFLARLRDMGITITAVFGGFEGESYADIPTVVKTVGLAPVATRAHEPRK